MSNLSNHFHAAYAAVIAPQLPNKFVDNRRITRPRLTPHRTLTPPHFTLEGEPERYPFITINDASTGMWIDAPNVVNLGYQPYNPHTPNWEELHAKQTSKKIRSTSLSSIANKNGSLYTDKDLGGPARADSRLHKSIASAGRAATTVAIAKDRQLQSNGVYTFSLREEHTHPTKK